VLSALASPHAPRADGVILVAPAVWSRSDMPLSYRAALWLGAHTLPSMTVSGRGLKIWPSDNIPMLRKLAHDPLFQHTSRADAVYGLVNLMDEARHAPERISHPPPILLLYGKNDQIIPRAPTEATLASLGPHTDARCYEHGYHMLLRDLEGPTVWKDVEAWIGARAARSPQTANSAMQLKISAQLDIEQQGRSEHGLAAGGERHTAELAGARADRCLGTGNERKVVAQ